MRFYITTHLVITKKSTVGHVKVLEEFVSNNANVRLRFKKSWQYAAQRYVADSHIVNRHQCFLHGIKGVKIVGNQRKYDTIHDKWIEALS